MTTSKLEQLRAMRERGQGGVRAEKWKASDRPAKAVTKTMLERAASAIRPKPRKKQRK